MAFALTKFEAMGVEIDEVVTKRFLQRSVMYITGLATDVDLDIGDYSGTFWTAVGATEPGETALAALKDIVSKSVAFNQVYGTGLNGKAVGGSVAKLLSSAASAGGAATEALTVTGLLTTDLILAVTQRVDGANSLPLLGWSTQIANGITGVWSADPGAGAIVDVAFLRESGAPNDGQYTLSIQNSLPNILFKSGDAPTSYILILEHELQDDQLPVKITATA